MFKQVETHFERSEKNYVTTRLVMEDTLNDRPTDGQKDAVLQILPTEGHVQTSPLFIGKRIYKR